MTGCASGANTVTISVSSNGNTPTGSVVIAEFGPLPPGSGIPSFKPFSGAQIPPTNLAVEGNGGVGNILPVSHGGTGVSTSTGTGSVVLSASPTLTGTVALPIVTLSGKVTNYNGIATVSDGVPAEYAKADLTAQAAAIAATTLYAVPASGAGMYRICWVAKVTTAATTSSTLGGTNGFRLLYTDQDDSVVVTTPAWWGGNNGAAPTSASLNTTQTYIGGDLIVNAKASTNIQYQMDYTSSGATAMAFNLHMRRPAAPSVSRILKSDGEKQREETNEKTKSHRDGT